MGPKQRIKMKLLIGLRFMFGFVPIFHLPVNRARLHGHGCCFVFSVNLLLFLPFLVALRLGLRLGLCLSSLFLCYLQFLLLLLLIA